MELREPDASDIERVREVARAALTASYALSPRQIEGIVEDAFGDEHLGRLFDDADAVALVAEDGGDGGDRNGSDGDGSDGDGSDEESKAVVGLVVGGLDGDGGEIQWLLVDPEHRGHGIGTRLFETAVETLRDRGVEEVRANTLQANADGSRFFERFGYVRTDERPIEIGDESLVEFVYAEASAAGERADSAKTNAGDVEFPDADIRDGVVTATTDDGQRLYVNPEDGQSGTEDDFFPTYVDEVFAERVGFYCANCGSLSVSVDSMDRLECGECGNSHSSRTSEAHDASYL